MMKERVLAYTCLTLGVAVLIGLAVIVKVAWHTMVVASTFRVEMKPAMNA